MHKNKIGENLVAESSLKNVEVHDLVKELADRMELNEEERDKFTRHCMTRAGYKATHSWAPPNGEEGSSGESDNSERKPKGWFKNE